MTPEIKKQVDRLNNQKVATYIGIERGRNGDESCVSILCGNQAYIVPEPFCHYIMELMAANEKLVECVKHIRKHQDQVVITNHPALRGATWHIADKTLKELGVE
jgi:hypothetical protein